MAAITAAGVAVTITAARLADNSRMNTVRIRFGNGADTYPSGGIPIPEAGHFGCRMAVDMLLIGDDDSGSGIFWKYDWVNKKLRGYGMAAAAGANTPLLEVNTSFVPATNTTLYAVAVGK